MKLLRFGPAGHEKLGILDATGVTRDLSGIVPDIGGSVLEPDGLAALASIDPNLLPAVEGSPRIGACVGQVGKFICIGLNYSVHATKSGMDVPIEPVIFSKWISAICGPSDAVEMPREATKLDWEVELGVVIGKPAATSTRPML